MTITTITEEYCELAIGVTSNVAFEAFQVIQLVCCIAAFILTVYVKQRYRTNVRAFHENVQILLQIMMYSILLHCVSFSAFICVHLYKWLSANEDCNRLMMHATFCIPFRYVFLTSVFGLVFTYFFIALERVLAFMFYRCYSRISRNVLVILLGLMVTVITGLLITGIHEENFDALQYNCGFPTGNAGPMFEYFFIMMLFVDCTTLGIFLFTYWACDYIRKRRFFTTAERYHISETQTIIRLLTPVIVVNFVIFGFYALTFILIEKIAKKDALYATLYHVYTYVIPYYACVLPILLAFFIERITRQRRSLISTMMSDQPKYNASYHVRMQQAWSMAPKKKRKTNEQCDI